MPIKKSELYSSLWASCDELRGGMDASQYKDYVLVLLFIKYISDKYAGQPYAPITIPKGASFKDLVALKGKSTIGDDINKRIIAPLAKANKLSDLPDFNDAGKLGGGKEMVERLTNLIAIFENRALDFSKNRADGDDILGDAYEYLMRHFATESGKSKGQFYTPAEVSRIMAQILGIKGVKTRAATTVYDPTCGSGSLLLKVSDEAGTPVTLYGQEKDAATSGLARMNMILHNNPTALIVQGNTLADPKFKDGAALKTFDYVVANPPFSDKRWRTGLDPLHDTFGRFEAFGVPPAKQGDYAYLLHVVRSLKSTGRGACILPHGVLFRGNAEADIRKTLVRKGYIKGVIGLPPNLFYGTGIPACIVMIDKQEAAARKGVFMVDASAGFMKEGPKNRLREQDIHRIVDAFTKLDDSEPRYARMVGFEEIEKNDYNLNLPRYIDSQREEDRQDIEGHLKGGIPAADIDELKPFWMVCPDLRAQLFKPNRPGYVDLAVDKAAIKTTIHRHHEFEAFINGMNAWFEIWRGPEAKRLKALRPGFHP
jgi:type I restriction enzyme M protein